MLGKKRKNSSTLRLSAEEEKELRYATSSLLAIAGFMPGEDTSLTATTIEQNIKRDRIFFLKHIRTVSTVTKETFVHPSCWVQQLVNVLAAAHNVVNTLPVLVGRKCLSEGIHRQFVNYKVV